MNPTTKRKIDSLGSFLSSNGRNRSSSLSFHKLVRIDTYLNKSSRSKSTNPKLLSLSPLSLPTTPLISTHLRLPNVWEFFYWIPTSRSRFKFSFAIAEREGKIIHTDIEKILFEHIYWNKYDHLDKLFPPFIPLLIGNRKNKFPS